MPRRRNPAQTPAPPPENVELTVDILRPAPYNPRRMTPAAKSALEHSLQEFGDISGITFNRRTGNLVTGHQRMDILKQTYGNELELIDNLDGTYLKAPSGDTYPVRVVDWDEQKEKAANVAANSHYLSASFDDEALHGLLSELEADAPRMMDGLRLDELLADVTPQEQRTAAGEAEDDFTREGFSSVTYSGPETKINEIKRLVSEKRNQLAEGSDRNPRDIPAAEALYHLLTDPPTRRRR